VTDITSTEIVGTCGPAEREVLVATASIRMVVKEVGAFGIFGVLGLIVDLSVFNLLFDSGQVVAKCTSTTAAMVVTYFGNRYVSFSHRAQSKVNREAATFVLVNLAALAMGVAVLALFEYPLHLKGDHLVMNIVNLATIGAGTAFRFWAYKRFVFLRPELHLPTIHLPQRPHVTDVPAVGIPAVGEI
jgi:putative flippase GtrA